MVKQKVNGKWVDIQTLPHSNKFKDLEQEKLKKQQKEQEQFLARLPVKTLRAQEFNMTAPSIRTHLTLCSNMK